jgi:heptosyltransferase III
MFLTPAIRYLHELLPHASIDLVLAHREAKDLLSDLPGVRRVIVFPHKTPGMIWRYLAALRTLRACRYDLAVDPIPESTSGRAVLTLCRARYRLGFTVSSQWAPLTHGLPQPPDFGTMHQAVRPVFLLSRIFGTPYEPHNVRLWLPLPEHEIAAGRRLIAQVTNGNPSQINTNAFGFFAHAATLKLIDRAWWLAFWEAFLALEPQALPVEFLPSPQHAPVDAHFASLHVPSLRGLTAAIAATRMFISTDTGPMHLASSTAVPTVGLFHSSDPALFRPLKSNDLAMDIAQSSPRAVAYRCQQIWRASKAAAAEAVTPALIRGLPATAKRDGNRGRVSRA